jgi:hypothetical protein
VTTTTATGHSYAELAALLSQNLGTEKATELVVHAAKELTFSEPLSTSQCLEVLERIAAQPGLVGIAARFAKSRVLLRWSMNE